MTTVEISFVLVVHLVLTGLPGAAAALFAARRGVAEVPILLAIGLAASGAVAMISFWAFYAEPVLGETFSFFVVAGSIALLAWSLWGGHLDGALLRALAIPVLLWCFGTGFLVFLGYAHGGSNSADSIFVATSRFSHQLPGDNLLPSFFADWFYLHGHSGDVPIGPGEWLSSDRPPLQIGYVLSQRPFGWDSKGLSYQVTGVVLQQLWIVGLWAFLLAAKVRRQTAGLVIFAVLLSGLAIVNGFFVWPKLLPAAMLLAAAALVMTSLWDSVRRSLWGGALIAALFALAMLGHGSSAFGIVPLVLIAAWRGIPSWRWIGVGLAVGIVLMGSWSAYQKYGDPPGNRVTKWSLAGVIEIDDRGTLEAMSDEYRRVGLSGTVDNKLENFETMVGGEQATLTAEAALDDGSVDAIIRGLRSIEFYYLIPAMGLLLLGPLVMAFGWRRSDRDQAEWKLALSCFLVVVVGSVFWGLALFGGVEDRAVLHVSSYLIPILAAVGCVVGLRALYPRFALFYVLVASLLNLAIYVPVLDALPETVYSPAAYALAFVSLVSFALIAFFGEGGLRLAQLRKAPILGRPRRKLGLP